MSAGGANHGGIVGAECGGRDADRDGAAGAHFVAQPSVCGDAAGEEDFGDIEFAGEAGDFGGEDIDDGFLELPGEFGGRGGFIADGVEDGGFESTQGEIAGATEPRAGEAEGAGVGDGSGEFGDFGTAGEGESEEASGFIEGFAGGVIEGAAEALVVAVVAHEDEVGVASGDDEAEGGEVDWGAFDEPVGVDVSFEVVDAEEGEVASEGDGFAEAVSDEEGAGEAGAAGGANGLDVIEGGAGFGEGFAHDGGDLAEVFAAGDFGHDAAVAGVEVDL